MSSYGVVSTGFAKKSLDDLLEDLTTTLTQINAALGEKSRTGDSMVGQLRGGIGTMLSTLWDVSEAIYRAFDIDSAADEALDLIGKILGVRRLRAAKSTVTLTLTLGSNVTVPAGSVVSHEDDSTIRFVTDSETVSTTSGDYTAAATAESAGEWQALAGKLTVIESAVSGWTVVTNAADADVGRDRESNAAYRSRLLNLQQASGGSTPAAIKSDVGNVADVTSVFVFNNPTDAEDADGVPAHAFEVVALGGDDDEIAQAIYDNAPAGIEPYGSTSGNAVDLNGDAIVVAFSRPTEKAIKIEVTLTTDSDYPVDGDDQVAAALVEAIGDLDVGDDVILTTLYSSIYSVAGVVDVTLLRIAFTADGFGTSNLTIGTRELATLDSGEVTVL